jgi:hypothetical protein
MMTEMTGTKIAVIGMAGRCRMDGAAYLICWERLNLMPEREMKQKDAQIVAITYHN